MSIILTTKTSLINDIWGKINHSSRMINISKSYALYTRKKNKKTRKWIHFYRCQMLISKRTGAELGSWHIRTTGFSLGEKGVGGESVLPSLHSSRVSPRCWDGRAQALKKALFSGEDIKMERILPYLEIAL